MKDYTNSKVPDVQPPPLLLLVLVYDKILRPRNDRDDVLPKVLPNDSLLHGVDQKTSDTRTGEQELSFPWCVLLVKLE